MKVVFVFCLVLLLFHGVFSHMPTLYEICSNVIARGNTSYAKCDSSQCHGRPGKRGIQGPRGFPGIKGERGESGTAEHLEERIKYLEDYLWNMTQIPKNPEICYMGVKNRNIISDSQITASSIYDSFHQACYGRLDNVDRSGGKQITWASKRQAIGEWHQVDFGLPKPIGGIVTQGRQYTDQWVKSFEISCGNSTSTLTTIQENGADKIFAGNTDRSTKVTNMFRHVMICRYIRVYPQSWNRHMSMRVEYIDGMCHDFL